MFQAYPNISGNVPGVEKGKVFYVAMMSGTLRPEDGTFLKEGQKGNVAKGDDRGMRELAVGTSWFKADLDLEMTKVTPKNGKSTFQMEMDILDTFASINDSSDLMYGAFATGEKRNCFSLQRTLLEGGGADIDGWAGDLFKVDPGTRTRIPNKYLQQEQ